jgi:ribosomal-protein-alanine N-acetyltransferase
LICRREDGAILGAVNLNEIVRGPAQSAFLGYWIGAAHARQGYMTEALQLALRHGFGILKLHRVEANILPVNRPSIALVRRAGFRREGYSPRYLRIAGRWADHERWALLSERWRPRA